MPSGRILPNFGNQTLDDINVPHQLNQPQAQPQALNVNQPNQPQALNVNQPNLPQALNVNQPNQLIRRSPRKNRGIPPTRFPY
jgi:hypothetical protein